MGALHQGSDGGGSIRMPAGYTGVYGIKPTFGRVPAYPLSPFGTVAHIGPMTRTVADSALIDRKSVVAGKSVSVRVDLGGRRIIKKKKHYRRHHTLAREMTLKPPHTDTPTKSRTKKAR